MLEHADAGNFVESIGAEPFLQIAVVEQQHFDTIAEPLCAIRSRARSYWFCDSVMPTARTP